MFVKINNKIVNTDSILSVRCDHLHECRVTVHYKESNVLAGMPMLGDSVSGQQAIDLLMRLDPSMLEGKRFKYLRHTWALHNIIGHPILQIMCWLGKSAIGFKVHDGTIPRPAPL